MGKLTAMHIHRRSDRATARTPKPMLMVDGSNDVFRPKDVPFGGVVYKFAYLGAWLPKTHKFGGKTGNPMHCKHQKTKSTITF